MGIEKPVIVKKSIGKGWENKLKQHK